MWTVRAVRIEDLDALHALVQAATQGLTSLQLDRPRLLDRVEQSVFAFTRTSPSPRGEPYVLVLADDQTGELVGTSTIYAKTGGYQPFYVYRVVHSEHYSEQLGVHTHHRRLELERIHDGPTEIGSLFLRRKYRGSGLGRWLSLARFALIAMLPHRFADRVIAEMRGCAEPDGTVPFWEAVAGRFIPVDFATADTMSTVSKQFIEELLPEHPIYLDLLPGDVQQGIGAVHEETRSAIAMLKGEGFAETDWVDIFDAGPVVSCETAKIKAVQRSRRVRVKEIVDSVDSASGQLIVASGAGGFTSVLAEVLFDGNELRLCRRAADLLQVAAGDSCIVLALH